MRLFPTRPVNELEARRTMSSGWASRSACVAITILLASSDPLSAQQGVADGQWPYYGGDAGSTKYSALDQITAENVSTLKTQWFWGSPETARIKENRRLGSFAYESTPLLIDGVLYVSSSHSDVIAVDPDFRGQGLGKAAMLEGLNYLHEVRGATRAILYVEDANAAGRRLYRGLGFIADELHRAYRWQSKY